MVIQKRVLAPTVAVSCWFGQVAMARFWGGDAKQATTQTVASAAPRLADTSGRREIAHLLIKPLIYHSALLTQIAPALPCHSIQIYGHDNRQRSHWH